MKVYAWYTAPVVVEIETDGTTASIVQVVVEDEQITPNTLPGYGDYAPPVTLEDATTAPPAAYRNAAKALLASNPTWPAWKVGW